MGKHSSDRKAKKTLSENSEGAVLSERSKKRNVGVEQNPKPQRLRFKRVSKVFKAERS